MLVNFITLDLLSSKCATQIAVCNTFSFIVANEHMAKVKVSKSMAFQDTFKITTSILYMVDKIIMLMIRTHYSNTVVCKEYEIKLINNAITLGIQ